MYVIVNYFSLINESNHTCIFSCIYGFLRKNIVKLYTYLYSIFIFHKVRVPFCWIWSRNYRALVNILRLGAIIFLWSLRGAKIFWIFSQFCGHPKADISSPQILGGHAPLPTRALSEYIGVNMNYSQALKNGATKIFLLSCRLLRYISEFYITCSILLPYFHD